MSHSQWDEEEYILNAVRHIEKGRFLDVGAYDGETFSNTYALARKGWSGVYVEPAPHAVVALLEHTAGFARTIVQAAVTEHGGVIPMHMTRDMVSTTEQAHYDLWKDTVPYISEVMVPSVTLDYLLRTGGPFQFINLDTEGISARLFLQYAHDARETPQCWCVEHDGLCDEVEAAARRLGYVATYKNGTNIVLVMPRRTS